MTPPARRRPSDPAMTNRAIRVPDDLWSAALAAAAERDEVLSDVIRDALRRYVARSPRA